MPIELVDATKQPLVLAVAKNYPDKELRSFVLELVVVHPLLRDVFPHVTRENVGDLIQVCTRSDAMAWVSLGKMQAFESMREEQATRVQLVPEAKEKDAHVLGQVLVESKFEADAGDGRSGKFYSDVAWRLVLEMGQLIDALDTENQWYESRVMESTGESVKVHYRSWSSEWDEWLSRMSPRLAPLHTHVADEILVGAYVRGKQYPQWRHARVTACDTSSGSLLIEVDVNGKKRWLDAQDELLCPMGTHNAVRTSSSTDENAWRDHLAMNQRLDARGPDSRW
ncbi:hypothetical protein PsorP6_010977 [Peronosclerospora sorghi]|uniref:Uncharacterized protein n=1 Tax=Peronosclerospora sorghi TaxID=230839 RepID=A0ACC0VV24_9STRA|nr:hypothetical protein PsorP6_010977 [Peronosclerospora sorghi]